MSGIDYEELKDKIYKLRGYQVLLDSDLAELYGIETKALKRAVRRNIERFPDDFMFEMTKEELKNWRYQFGASNKEKMGMRVQPFVFTEQGVAMLSSVLKSTPAIQVNISIIRLFVRMRRSFYLNKDLIYRLESLEVDNEDFKRLFQMLSNKINKLESNIPLKKDRKKIGLKT